MVYFGRISKVVHLDKARPTGDPRLALYHRVAGAWPCHLDCGFPVRSYQLERLVGLFRESVMFKALFRIVDQFRPVNSSIASRGALSNEATTPMVESGALATELLRSLAAATELKGVLAAFRSYVTKLIPDPYVSLWSADYDSTAAGELLLVDEFGWRELNVALKHSRVLFGEGIVGRVAVGALDRILDFSTKEDSDLALAQDVMQGEGHRTAICERFGDGAKIQGVVLVSVHSQFVFTDAL